jgi:hypothetical protein
MDTITKARTIEEGKQTPNDHEELTEADRVAVYGTPVLLTTDQLDALLGTSEDPNHAVKKNSTQAQDSHPDDVTTTQDNSAANAYTSALIPPMRHHLDFFSKQPKSGLRDRDSAAVQGTIQETPQSDPGAFHVTSNAVVNSGEDGELVDLDFFSGQPMNGLKDRDSAAVQGALQESLQADPGAFHVTGNAVVNSSQDDEL